MLFSIITYYHMKLATLVIIISASAYYYTQLVSYQYSSII